MLPEISGSPDVEEYAPGELPSLTYHMHDELDRIIGNLDDASALKQSIMCMLSTDREAHVIYSSEYGSELYKLVGKPKDYCCAEIERMVYESLMADDRITDVTDFDFVLNQHDIETRFVVHTVFGDINSGVKVDV
jgi:phage baseplate assembly protein W